jgi:hypothetical protein
MVRQKNKEIEMSAQEIVKTEGTPAMLIENAIAKGANLDQLEKLLTLQERWETNEARKAYHDAMAKFKANPPIIDKDKTVSYGTTKYNHASLANVTAKINAELSKYGLSASWSTQQNGSVSVTCRITHVKGHSEATTLSAQADNSGAKNAIQAIGSTITYLERYTLLALTGLATSEQDDDGAGATVISEEQVLELEAIIAERGVNKEKFLKYAQVDAIDNIMSDKFDVCKKALLSTTKHTSKP